MYNNLATLIRLISFMWSHFNWENLKFQDCAIGIRYRLSQVTTLGIRLMKTFVACFMAHTELTYRNKMGLLLWLSWMLSWRQVLSEAVCACTIVQGRIIVQKVIKYINDWIFLLFSFAEVIRAHWLWKKIDMVSLGCETKLI